MKKSHLELIAWNRIKSAKLPLPFCEYKFCKDRRWRFDFCWADRNNMVAVEIEGGVFMRRGGHTSGIGYTKNCEKYNAATIAGWSVLRYTTANLDQLIPDLKKILS